MQKKIIASLLVSPLAFNAMANIALPKAIDNTAEGNKWVASGVIGDFNIFQPNGEIKCPVGGGVLSQKITVEVPGTYRVAIDNPENATLKAVLSDKTVEAVTPEGATKPNNFVEFEVTGKTEVTIEVSAINASTDYSFEGANLQIVYDFKAANKALTEALGKAYTYIGFDPANDSQTAKDLKKESLALQVKVKAIREEIKELVDESLDAYKKYELYNDPDNKIAKEIEALKVENDDLATRIKAENTRFANYKANNDALNAIIGENGEIATLIDELDAVKTVINNEETKVSDATRADYVAKADALKAEIDAYKAAAEAAYKNGENVKDDALVEEFPSQMDALLQKIEDLQSNFETAVKAEAAQTHLNDKSDELSEAYTTAQNTILRGIETIEGYENVYSDKKSEWMRGLTNANTAAVNTIADSKKAVEKATTEEEVAEAKKNADDAVKTATDAFNKTVADAQALVAAENTAMTDALATIKGIQDDLDAQVAIYNTCKKAGLDVSSVEEDFDTQKRAADAAIKTLTDKVKDFYAKHKLSDADSDYSTEVTDANDEVKKLKDLLDGANLAEKAKAQTDLNKLIDALNAADKDLKLTEEQSLFSKFNQVTIPDLQKGVKDLEGAYAGSQLATAITENGDYVQDVIEAFKGAAAAKLTFKPALNDLKTVVNAKYFNLGFTGYYDRTADGMIDAQVKAMQDLCDKWIADYETALTADAQTCYKKAKAIVDDMAKDENNWEVKVNTTFRDFVRTVTEANKKVADDKKADAKTKLTASLNAADANNLFTNVEKELTAINTAWGKTSASADANKDFFNTADRNALVKTYADIDAKIKTAMVTIDNLFDNQKIYSDLLDQIDSEGVTSVDTSIANLLTYNTEHSTGKAVATFKDKIDGSAATSIKSQRDALVNKLKAELKALTVKKNQESLKSTLKSINDQIAQLETDIDANEEAYKDQQATGKDALNHVANYMADMTMQDSGNFAQAWIDQLAALIDEDLATADKAVETSHDNATAKADKTANEQAYTDVKAKADEIWSSFNSEDGFKKAVTDYNNEQIKTLQTSVNDIDDAYKGAVKSFNGYDSMDNEGYINHLKGMDPSPIITHEEVYKYSTVIRDLKTELSTALSDANTKLHALSDEEIAALKKKITGATAEINTMVTKMVAGYDNGGTEYYTQYEPQVKKLLDDANAAILAAGLEQADADGILETAKGFYDQAKTAYEAEMNKAADAKTAGIGYLMDGIADNLDKVEPNIDLQGGALKYWADLYAEAEAEFAGFEARFKAIEVTPTDAFNTAKSDAAILNTTVTNPAEGTDVLAGLKDNKKTLDGYVAQAKAEIEKAEQDKAANEANEKAYTDYKANELADLDTKLNTLKDAVKAFGTTGTAVTDAETAVEAVKTAVETGYKNATLVADADAIKTLVDAAEKAISDGYDLALDAELEHLETLVSTAKVEYNNAFAADNKEDINLDEIKDAIDTAIEAVEELKNDTEATGEEKADKAVELEKKLSEIIYNLEKSHKNADETTYGKYIAELTKVVDNDVEGEDRGIQQQLDDVSDILADYEAEATGGNIPADLAKEYSGLKAELEDLKNELADLKAGYADPEKKAELLGQIEKYRNALIDLQEKLDALTPRVEANKTDVQKKAVSNSRYAELKAEYDGINSDLADLKAMLEEYKLTNDFKVQVTDIESKLARTLVDLDAAKKDFSLTADSELEPEATQAADAIEGATLNAKKMHAENLQVEANAELTKVNEALKNPNIVGLEALLGELDDLRDESDKLDSDIEHFIADISKYDDLLVQIDGYIQASQDLAAKATALLDKIGENSFTPGDVDGDGVVDINDIQYLASMIATNTKYAALEPTMACAADVTGDKAITIADFTKLVNHIFFGGELTNTFALRMGAVPSDSSIDAVLVGEEGDVRTYEINLANKEAFVAGQFDLSVAPGSEIVSVKAANRISSHEMYLGDNMDFTRVVIGSMENAEIAGNDGATVIVEVKGRSTVGISNAIFADENSQSYSLGDKTPGTSGIDSILDSAKAMKTAIYDAAGRALKSVQRGINIIRHSDGTVTKELHK